MESTERYCAAAGVVSVALTLAAIAGAVVAAPSFTLADNALSDLGQPGNAAATPVTTLLFDGGLIAGGVVGLPFAAVLWRGERHWLARSAAVPFVGALLGMAGVGLFPAGQPLHVPAALTLYLGSMVAMGLDGLGTARSDLSRRAAGTFGLLALHVSGWWWWARGGPVLRPGLAIPELLGAGVFGAWVVWTARWQTEAPP